ncbi:MAG: DUF4389 domain-containing protein [Rhodoferax sp.]|uniref:DUF4389 domain-containing protein n=1 Tax=Rhodoferax sp. TaxID=50421 RepID=UPI00184AEE1F|nr:DUF4389 domain-containing protein [Rhodoferax sp.]NMM12781.1 DUF4389 domain-containing protein [Rhodoferax sp.]NMM19874.1 DUF4389 domain-containing protein [Rhodoferax sp.]
MSEFPAETKTERNIWLRGLLMILMALAYQLASTLLFCVAIIQFVLMLVSDAPNTRLSALGRSLGRYQGQIANFVSFATEEVPFPFTDWPSSDQLRP